MSQRIKLAVAGSMTALLALVAVGAASPVASTTVSKGGPFGCC